MKLSQVMVMVIMLRTVLGMVADQTEMMEMGWYRLVVCDRVSETQRWWLTWMKWVRWDR